MTTTSRITFTETTPRPIVKDMHPDLYSRHTAHMCKAEKLTYNYSNLDDFIAVNYANKSMRLIAKETNEYFERVLYRVQVLKQLGLIKSKNNPRSGKRIALIREMTVLNHRIKEIKQMLTEQLDKHQQDKVKMG